jgi:hypothetical protein
MFLKGTSIATVGTYRDELARAGHAAAAPADTMQAGPAPATTRHGWQITHREIIPG